MFGHNLAILAIFAVVVLAILRQFAHRKETSLFSASRLLMGFSAIVVVIAIRRGAISLYALALIAAVWGISHAIGVLGKRRERAVIAARTKTARS